MSPKLAWVVSCALSLWLAGFTLLGLDHAVGDGDECIHASILRDMMRSGDYLSPTFHGQVGYSLVMGEAPLMFERPLLPYWLAAAFASLVPDEVGIRLSSALASFATLVVVFLAARRCWGRTDAAFVAAVLLAGSPSFHSYSRTLLSDPPLVLGTAIAVASAVLMLREPRWLLGVAFGLGFAVASKSLIAGVPALALSWWLLRGAIRADGRTRLFAAGVLGLTALPYYAMGVALHGSDFLRAHFGEGLAQRANSSHGVGLAGGALAYVRWTLEAEGAVTAAWLALGTVGALAWGLRRGRAELVLLGSFGITVTVVFSLLSTRLPHYLLPLHPAAALGVAGLYADFTDRTQLTLRRFGVLLGPALAMIVLLEGRRHPGGDVFLLQRPMGRELGLVAQRITAPGQKVYAFDWYAPALAYYADRPLVLLTAHARRFAVVSSFAREMRLVPPAPEPVGTQLVIAGDAPTLSQSAWLHVDEVVAHSASMFLARAHVVAAPRPAPTAP